MTPTRKAPHCRTCHKPLKGHRRGVCDDEHTTELEPTPLVKKSAGRKSAPLPDPIASSPAPTKKPNRGRKSAPLPLESLPTLSPQSSQILNNILRKNSGCSDPTFCMPGALRNGANNLHVALARLSANDKESNDKESKGSETPSESQHISTKVEEDESPGEEEHGSTQNSAAAVSQQLGFAVESDSHSDSETSTLTTHTAQHHTSSAVASPAEMTIQNFLDSTAQSLQYPPATIFSFPANGVPALEKGAHRLGLFVHILPLPSADEHWVPVVVGRNAGAVKKLLEDSEKLAQVVRKSGNSSEGEFRVGMGHIVAGTLGALATWAGLAYT